MKIEVEQKFPVPQLDDVRSQLAALGAVFSTSAAHVDTYFAHPMRNFAETDEALRIRNVGSDCFITYKGPKLDAITKSRREIELPLVAGEDVPAELHDLLEALGFEVVARVRKVRETGHLAWQQHTVEIALDEVDRVGTFLELETPATESSLDPARDAIASLATELGLKDGERRGYLELLLEKSPESGARR